MVKLKEIIKTPLSIIIFSSVLVFFNSGPAFWAVKRGLLIKDGVGFSFATAFSGFLIMFVLPAIAIKFVFKRPLSDFGLRIPDNLREAVGLSLLTIIIYLPIMLFLSGIPSFQKYYLVKQNFGAFLLLMLSANTIYYFSEEFIFRGFLFFGLWDKLKFHVFWIVNLIFAVFHAGKPPLEILVAFFSGLAFSYLSFRTKSFFPAVVVHLTLALILNILINFYPILYS